MAHIRQLGTNTESGTWSNQMLLKICGKHFKESCKNFKNHSSRLRKAQKEYRQRADGVHKLSKILKGEILQFDQVVAIYVHFRQYQTICVVFLKTALYSSEAPFTQIASTFNGSKLEILDIICLYYKL